MAGFKTLFSLWKDYNLVNEEIGYVNENVLCGDEFSHNRCSIGFEPKLVKIPTIHERLGDVQSGMLSRGGHGSQEVTGKTCSHFRHVSMQS